MTSKQKYDVLAADVEEKGPASHIRDVRDELLTLGLDEEAAKYDAILRAREKALAEAQAARNAEAAAEHEKAVAGARKIYDAEVVKYVAIRDEAVEKLAEYAALGRAGVPAWESTVQAHTNLRMLVGDGEVELPEMATTIVKRDERFQGMRV